MFCYFQLKPVLVEIQVVFRYYKYVNKANDGSIHRNNGIKYFSMVPHSVGVMF